MGTDDEDVFRYKCAFGAHYLALSHAISLYLAKRKICAVYLQTEKDGKLSTPSPPAGYSPLYQGESQLLPTRGHTYNL